MPSIYKTTFVYICSLLLVFSQTMPAYAGLIGTEQFMAQQLVDQDRVTLRNVVEREEARNLLGKHGVSTEQAHKRIDAMTADEVRILTQSFNELPKAGNVGVVAAVLILVLLLIALDLSGKTDIFKGI